MSTQTQAVSPAQPRAPSSNKKSIKDTLEGDQFKAAVAKVLPKHLTPDRFVRVAIMAMTRTPKLTQCDPASFFQALMSLSQYGLEPDGRRAHLIPFENRKRKCVECQLIIDYKGIAELVMRSGLVSYIHADVVCDNDDFEYDRGEVRKHRINLKSERGNVYAAYAICRFKDGSEKCDVMGKDEVEKIRRRSRAGDNGPWSTDWNEMAKKTVFRRLSKWLPLSPEVREAIESDDELELKRSETAKPIFESVENKPQIFELPEPSAEDETASDELRNEPENPGPEKSKADESKPHQDFVKAIRGLLQLRQHEESKLIAWLVETGKCDDTIRSIEDLMNINPARVQWVHDNFATVDKELSRVAA